ncbi:MAG: RsfS/YbeB/iojap family protein, partial [Aquificae bacterium]|nr:RsfS/YbeB/iojap family protein [Aquificota bacterium]
MEKLRLIKDLLEEKKAKDLVFLNVAPLTNLADYFVIASAESTTHARALADHLEEKL